MAQVQSTTFRSSKENVPLVRLEFNPETRIWVLFLLGEQTPDNRLTHALILEGIIPALQQVKDKWLEWVEKDDIDEGAALVTSSLPTNRIFSNGLDLFAAIADPNFFKDVLDRMFHAFLTFPIPTVASLGGHAFAGGYTLACAHDYRVQNGKKGYVCMNEIEFGAPIPEGMMATLRSVVPDNNVMRKVVLEGHRFSAGEALRHGLVDFISEGEGYEGPEGTLRRSVELAMQLRSRCAKNGFESNKRVIYKDLLAALNQPDRQSKL